MFSTPPRARLVAQRRERVAEPGVLAPRPRGGMTEVPRPRRTAAAPRRDHARTAFARAPPRARTRRARLPDGGASAGARMRRSVVVDARRGGAGTKAIVMAHRGMARAAMPAWRPFVGPSPADWRPSRACARARGPSPGDRLNRAVIARSRRVPSSSACLHPRSFACALPATRTRPAADASERWPRSRPHRGARHDGAAALVGPPPPSASALSSDGASVSVRRELAAADRSTTRCSR
jgi:hypothetical protein